MLPKHREGAPRLIEWTGERCVPWAPDVQVVYEHLHRYLWASRLTAGLRVLDLACGEGFGAAILSDGAEEVVGIDIDPRAAEHAKLNYDAPNLSFEQGDARDLSRFEDGYFGAAVAFEMIEHVDPQERVIAEIRRVLEPGGLLIISTPDTTGYAGGAENANPFHVHELSAHEFSGLLDKQFKHHAIWSQHVAEGSTMVLRPDLGETPAGSSDASSRRNFLVKAKSDEWEIVDQLPLVYMVAIASDSPLPSATFDSALSDPGQQLSKARLKELADRLNAEIDSRGEEIVRRGAAIQAAELQNERLGYAIRHLQTEANKRESDLRRLGLEGTYTRRELTHELERERREREQDRQQALARFEREGRQIDELWERVYGTEWELQKVYGSVSWQMLQRTRGKIFHTLGGQDSVGAKLIQSGMRGIGRQLQMLRNDAVEADPPAAQTGASVGELVSDAGTAPDAFDAAHGAQTGPSRAFEPIRFPPAVAPAASIVMPLFAGAELTERALRSILEHTLIPEYEMIIVDDGDDPDTKALLGQVHGARIISNEENLGYLRSVSKAAAVAGGRWLVLCNNDIEVRSGWLDELLDCGETASDIAIVTPKYLAADGSLSEAGGIIWRDGSGANYGRGDDPNRWRYSYRREVDYGSAAALLVRSSFWQDVGGFDERFLPMYYEDADLCFAARDLGMRVMYEPCAEVVHHEGSTAGTDESRGYKRHQALNQPKFVEKWKEVLQADHLPNPNGQSSHWAGATARRGARILVIDHRMPQWDYEAGALRELGILKTLLDLGHHVTFIPDNLHANEPYAGELQRLGVEVMHGHDVPNELNADVAPHIVLAFVSRPNVASRWFSNIRQHAPQAVLVYDTVDLHWVREARRAARAQGVETELLMTPEVTWTRELELALIKTADKTTVVTDEERRRIHEDVPAADVHVLPVVNPLNPHVPGPHARRGLLFVGGFEHTPNVDAVVMLVNDVMPLVWAQLDDVTLTIVGPNAPIQIEALGSDRVEIAGWVPSVEPLLDGARVMVAPLTYGAGLKGKVTQALAAGLPVVTTAIGAEGLNARDGHGVLIADDAAGLAERIVRVLNDDELWLRLSDEGQTLANRVCSPQVMTDALSKLVSGRDAEPSTPTGEASTLTR